MKKALLFTTLAAMTLSLVACGPKETVTTAQGVTDTKIVVGNTATEGGAWAFVGHPFNAGIRAYFEAVNEAGGIGGRTIELINRDDGFNGATGLANTEQLVEEDKIFALVGHFGTPTIAATMNYMKEVKIPMVYAASGENSLYTQKEVGGNVMPVQPIYKTEGRLLLARVFAEKDLFGTVNKVGVIYTNANDGNSIKAGIEEQATLMKYTDKVIYETVSGDDYSTAVQKMKAAGVGAVIVASNQAPFLGVYSAMNAQSFNVPVFTSYVNADATAVPAADYNPDRPIYCNAWVDIFSAKGQEGTGKFIADITAFSGLTDELKTAYVANSYAIAGYIAAHVFCEGLRAVETKTGDAKILNWANYISAMEGLGEIDIPMGGTVDFSEGKRWGIDSMSVLKYAPAAGETAATFAKVKEIETLTQVQDKIK